MTSRDVTLIRYNLRVVWSRPEHTFRMRLFDRQRIARPLALQRMCWTQGCTIADEVKYSPSPKEACPLLVPVQFIARLTSLTPAPRHPIGIETAATDDAVRAFGRPLALMFASDSILHGTRRSRLGRQVLAGMRSPESAFNRRSCSRPAS